MTQSARPDLARTPSRNDHARPGPAPPVLARLAASAAWLLRRRGLVPGWTVVSAGLSPVVVTAGWLVAGAVQPAAYDPVRATVSVMAGLRVPARIVLAVAGLSSI